MIICGEIAYNFIQNDQDKRCEKVGNNYVSDRSRLEDQTKESLCEVQIDHHRQGYKGLEVVRSLYGWTLRYRSGLDNRAIYKHSDRKVSDMDTPDDPRKILKAAYEWYSVDPYKRYVECRDSDRLENDQNFFMDQ